MRIKNATPADGQSLCRTCSYVHMQKGYRDSEELIFCTYRSWNAPRPVPFKVRDCTDYTDRDVPDMSDMEEMALTINPEPTLKRAGFRGNGSGFSDPAANEDND